MSIELTPPESVSQTEALSPPAPVKPVEKEAAASMVKLDMDTINKLEAKVDQFLNTVLSLDLQSEEFKEKVANIHALGNEEIRASANISNRLLDKPVNAMHEGFFDEKSNISQALVSLRSTVEDLDPAKQGDLLAPKKLFGLIPFGDKLRDYFYKYQSAQSHINKIIQALYDGKEELQKDNAAIEEEKVNAWNLMLKMEQYVYVGKKLDAALEAKIAQIEAKDAEKARVVKEEMLFYLRQKVTDLLTQLAVTVQGYLAMDMIRKNNLELIKGVDRATTTTVSALRTAVMVSQALTNQKLVLEQINALNSTTSNMIESTSNLLKQQASDIQQQASSSTVEIDKLKKAFQNIYDTMDMMSNYKVKALDNMKQTVDLLSGEVSKAKEYADKIREKQIVEVADTLKLTHDDDIRL
ncbi:MAG: toxic anion resistance protein [Gammaproteobacteria bacterium SG8_11]|nr:MAG: toxic anion resistance protein [Gammaproteobacteria bacterium SG8_11]